MLLVIGYFLASPHIQCQFKLCTLKLIRLRQLKLFFFSIGGFICIYVGNLYTNEEANKQGQDFGDEYFAELDLIEVVEGRKEGNFNIFKKKGFPV